MQPHSRRSVLRAAGTGAVVGLAGCVIGGESPKDDMASHRDDLSKYTDVARAAEDGFEMAPPYVRTDDGIVGLQLINHGAPELDPENPNALCYNLREDGSFELLGAKWLALEADYDAPPSMFGQEFFGPVPGETGVVSDHYGLHVWLFDDNPDGLFAQYHTGVEPPSYIDEVERAWEELDQYYSNEARAEANGYSVMENCIETSDGGYGIPAVNADYAGTDVGTPSVLLYRFSSAWSYRLMGAEWYVSADSTNEPPSMFGQEFHGPEEGHFPQSDQSEQPQHYGLHAWLFTANPDGMFAPYNPLIGC